MKSIKIKGKDYITVNERIKEFRENEKYTNWSIESEIIKLTEGNCCIKAIIRDNGGLIKATGIASEDKDDKESFVNKTSFVENCETSAWGRALGCLGIGIDDGIASAEEVINAMKKQDKFEVIGGDYIMKGGKNKGKKISEIDDDYLGWCLSSNNIGEEIKQNIEKYIGGKK